MGMEAKLQQQVPQKAQANKPNLTGIPTQMKLDFERRSGLSFDDVRVHYNSDKPAQLQALAYTQGTQVYVGPGQERHLKHELGHVVQQKSGRAHPMYYIKGMPINDQPSLEREADTLQTMPQINQFQIIQLGFNMPIQRKVDIMYTGASPNPWNIKSDKRPQFKGVVEHLFTDVLSPEDLGYEKTRSINHVISYHTINLLLAGLLSKQLNNPAVPKRAKEENILRDGAKGHIDWYNLMRMIIPKKTDYIVLHNLWEIETIINHVKYALSLASSSSFPFHNKESFEKKLKELLDIKLKYINILEAQRFEALAYIDAICTLLMNHEIPCQSLNALANDFESLLNNSVGNLRLGDAATNTTISAYIDPFAGSFTLDYDSKAKKYSIVFDDRSNQTEGELYDPTGTNITFHSKEKSMAKRMIALFELTNALTMSSPSSTGGTIAGTDQVVPAFQMADYTDTTGNSILRVLTSDIIQGDPNDSITLAKKPLDIIINHQKKKDVIAYSANTLEHISSTGAKKQYITTFTNINRNGPLLPYTGMSMTSHAPQERNLTSPNLTGKQIHVSNILDSATVLKRNSDPYPEGKRSLLSSPSLTSTQQNLIIAGAKTNVVHSTPSTGSKPASRASRKSTAATSTTAAPSRLLKAHRKSSLPKVSSPKVKIPMTHMKAKKAKAKKSTRKH